VTDSTPHLSNRDVKRIVFVSHCMRPGRLQDELDAARGGRPASPSLGVARRQSSLAGPHHGRASMAEPHGRPSFLPAALGDAGPGIPLRACLLVLCDARVFPRINQNPDESLRWPSVFCYCSLLSWKSPAVLQG
jgi:hypothetical protein